MLKESIHPDLKLSKAERVHQPVVTPDARDAASMEDEAERDACIDDERLRFQCLLVSSGQTPTAAYLLCGSLMCLATRHQLPALRPYKAVRGAHDRDIPRKKPDEVNTQGGCGIIRIGTWILQVGQHVATGDHHGTGT